MNPSPAESKAEAERTALAYHTPRYRKLDRLERYAKGTQYEGRPSFWNNDVPLQERAPFIRAPIAKRAIRGHVDLCLGEGRFPRITSFLSEDDSAFDPDSGLSKKDSEILDRFVAALVEQSRIREVSIDAMSNALECGTCVAIARIDDDQKLCVDLEFAKHCTPKYERGKLVELDIRYPHVVSVERKLPGQPSEWSYECRLYRRTIDLTKDTTFVSAKGSPTGGDPDAWIPDPEQTFAHNLGFVPVVWWRHGKKKTTANEIDGCAPHADLLDEIDGLNFSLSQRHRAARYAGDPQICEYGVESEDDVKAPVGREARTMFAGEGDHPRNRSIILDHAGKPMRRRGPGSIWTYTNSTARCEYLTLPAGALDSLVGDIRELYAMIRDALGYVDLDPANVKTGADMSGRTIEWLYQNSINFCNRLRPDFADGFLLPLVSILLRFVSVVNGRGESLRIPGFTKAAPIVARFADEGRWQPPTMRCIWGQYFGLSEGDRKVKQERVLGAYEAGLITEQTAIEEIATLYPTIGDPAQYLKALAEERKKKMTAMHDAQAALADAGTIPDDEGSSEEGNDSAPPKKNESVPKKPIAKKEKGKLVSIPEHGKVRREVKRPGQRSSQADSTSSSNSSNDKSPRRN